MSINNDTLVTKLNPDYLISTTKKLNNEQLNKLVFLINSELDANAQITTRTGVSKSSEMILVALSEKTKAARSHLESIVQAFDKSFQVLDIESEFQLKNKSKFSAKVLKKIPLLKPLSRPELTKLSEITSPDVALHFAFVQTYTAALIPLAVCGLAMRFSAPDWEFNYAYTGYLFLWTFVFVNYWKHFKQPSFNYLKSDLHASFSSSSSSATFSESSTFGFTNSNTNFVKKLMFVPVAYTFMVSLLCLQLACFVLEIFLTQLYDGSFKSIITLSPTIIGCIGVPVLTAVYSIFVNKMVEWEKTPSTAHRSTIEKNFTLTFMTSYFPLLITLFLYLPYGYLLNPELENIRAFCNEHNIPVVSGDFEVNIERFRQQFFYFIVTNNIIALAMDIGLPFVMDFVSKKFIYKELNGINENDNTQEAEFLARARYSVFNPWGSFDPLLSYGKYVVQFGFVAMFSTIWPLAPLFAIVFNILSFKIDLWKVLNKTTIVTPQLVTKDQLQLQNNNDAVEGPLTIEPWNSILSLIAWMSTLVSPGIFIMYKYSFFPNVGVYLGKRDLWYMEKPISYDWKTIVSVIAIVEHIGFAINFIFGKLASFKAEKVLGVKSGSFQHTILTNEHAPVTSSAIIIDEKSGYSSAFEDSLKSEDLKSTTHSRKSPEPVKPGNVYTQVPRTASPTLNKKVDSSNQNPVVTKVQNQDPYTNDGPTVTSKNVKNPPTSDHKHDFSFAGATLPRIIPTSHNFDSRQGLNDTSSVETSNLSSVVESQSSKQILTAPSSAQPLPKQEIAQQKEQERVPIITHTNDIQAPRQRTLPQTQAKTEFDPASTKLAGTAAAAALKEPTGHIMATVHEPVRGHSRTPSITSRVTGETKKKKKTLFSKIKNKL